MSRSSSARSVGQLRTRIVTATLGTVAVAAAAALVATSPNAFTSAVPSAAPAVLGVATSSGVSLTLAKAADDVESENGIVVGGTTGTVLGKFRWTASGDQMAIRSLKVNVGNSYAASAIDSVSLFDGATLVAGPVALAGSVATFADSSFVVPQDGSRTMTVKANLKPVGGAAGVSSGIFFVPSITADASQGFVAKATGLSNAVLTSVSGPTTATGNTKVLRRSKPTVTPVSLPSGVLTNGTGVVYRFSVAADPRGDIALKKLDLQLEMGGVFGIVVPAANSSIREVGQASAIAGASHITGVNDRGSFFCNGADQDAAGPDRADSVCHFRAVFASEQVVAAGTTKTYEVRLGLNGVGSGESLSSFLIGDTTQVTGELEAGDTPTQLAIQDFDRSVGGASAAKKEQYFIWSDMSAAPHTETLGGTTGNDTSASNDWTNGLYVKVLPSDAQSMTQ
jgi:hypothetical protein